MSSSSNGAPEVSVITIFLNGERFLDEAIQSVFAQSFSNWELLLVDDGSTDRSTEIAQRYAAAHPERVRYLTHPNHENRGMSATRNLGIQHARGKYIAFLDADDVWVPHKLADQVGILAAHPEAGLVCGRTHWWYGWTNKPEDMRRDFLQNYDVSLDTVIRPPGLLMCFLRDAWASLCDILVRTDLVREVGGYEESFRGMYEDQAFHAKLCLRAPALVSRECWYRYRQHPGACTAVSHSTGETDAARTRFFTWLENYVSKNGSAQPEVRRFVRAALWPQRQPVLHALSQLPKHAIQVGKTAAKLAGRAVLPTALRQKLRAWRHGSLGNLRRLEPVSRHWGFERGLPIDRYYIEQFLALHAEDVRDRVLEIAEPTYTHRFGGNRVVKSDVLHVTAGNPEATIIADLSNGANLESNAFDSIICTQTLPFIYDFHSAIRTLHRVLKPGGVLLATFAGITKVSSNDMRQWGDFWRFTTASARRMFSENFPSQELAIYAYGNVLTATAFLHGIASQELNREELLHNDPDYELLIAVRVAKSE